jgi:hypothetical protein
MVGLSPDWILSRRWVVTGALVLPVLLVIRISFHRVDSIFTPLRSEMSAAELARDYLEFATRSRRDTLIGRIVFLLVMGTSIGLFWFAPTIVLKAGHALNFAAMLFIARFVAIRARVQPLGADLDFRTIATHYQIELERQRRVLRGVWWWCLMPMVPGMVLLVIGRGVAEMSLLPSLLALAGMLLMLLAVGWLNTHGARRIERKIDALAAVRESL